MAASINNLKYARIDLSINAGLQRLLFTLKESAISQGSLGVDVVSGHANVIVETSDNLLDWEILSTKPIFGTNSVLLPFSTSQPAKFLRAKTLE